VYTGNCDFNQVEMTRLSPTNLINTTAFRRTSSRLDDETFSLWTLQSCSGGELLTTCGKFVRLGICAP